MLKFSNDIVEISELPMFEDIELKPLQKKFFKVVLFNLALIFIVLIIAFSLVIYFKENIFSNRIWMIIGGIIPVLFCLILYLLNLSFHKKGYAFRTHDAIYKSGLISESTTVVPFNRVQHVALHQGFIERYLGLASIELFTAGGSSSDLEIPGLLLEEAQQIKNMVSQKINPPKQAPFKEYPEQSLPENIISESNE